MIGGRRLKEFQKIYEEYAKPVYRFLLSMTADEDLAEELLAETFYKALRHIDRFEGRCSIYTWLCRIGKNEYFRERRRSRRLVQMPSGESVTADDVVSMEERAEDRDVYCRAAKAVDRLPEPYREVFVLHTFGEIKLKEIADLKGKSESWARVTYFRARQMIAKEVTE